MKRRDTFTINPEEIPRTQEDMRAKLAWATRALDLMEQIDRLPVATAQQHAIEFQDAFWSFLSAGESLWFYLNRLCEDAGLPKKTAQRLLQDWRASHLVPADDVLFSTLRNADVHTAPIHVQVRAEHRRLRGPGGGRLRGPGGGIVGRTVVVFSAVHDGTTTNCLVFARACLPVLERMIDQLPVIVARMTAAPSTSDDDPR